MKRKVKAGWKALRAFLPFPAVFLLLVVWKGKRWLRVIIIDLRPWVPGAPQKTEILLPPCGHPDFAHDFLCSGGTIVEHDGCTGEKGPSSRREKRGLHAKLLTWLCPGSNTNLNPKANRVKPNWVWCTLGEQEWLLSVEAHQFCPVSENALSTSLTFPPIGLTVADSFKCLIPFITEITGNVLK